MHKVYPTLNIASDTIAFKKICTILGMITPISTLKHIGLRKFYAVFILAVLSLGNVYSLSIRNKSYKEFFFMTHETLDYIDTITLLLCISTTIASLMIFNHKKWKQLEIRFQEINKYIIYTGTIRKSRNICSVASICVFLVINSYIWIIWTYHVGLLKSIKTYLMHFIAWFYNCILIEFIINITLLLRNYYIYLNNCIKKITKQSMQVKVKSIKFVSRILLDTVESFNILFGWAYFFLISNFVVKLLKNFDFIVSRKKFINLQFKNELIIIGILEGCFSLVNIVIVIN